MSDLLSQEEFMKLNSARRAERCQTIGRAHGCRAVPLLREALDDTNAAVRYAAVEGLANIDDVCVIEPLLYAVADRTERIRRLAARILQDRHDSLGRLLQAALSGSEEALAQLIQTGDQRVVAPMVRVCIHGTLQERTAAIEVLIGTGPGQAICLLRKELSTASTALRRLLGPFLVAYVLLLCAGLMGWIVGYIEDALVDTVSTTNAPPPLYIALFVFVVVPIPFSLAMLFYIDNTFTIHAPLLLYTAFMKYYTCLIGAHRLFTALTQRTPRLLCSRHLTRLRRTWAGPLKPSFPTCRQCDTTAALREFGKVVVGLDRSSTAIEDIQGDTLWVNWLRYRQLFDFDEVELVDASEEDVERFDTQVRNDPDKIRQKEYKKMLCTVGFTCHLSENTLRSLRHTFGRVEIAQKGG